VVCNYRVDRRHHHQQNCCGQAEKDSENQKYGLAPTIARNCCEQAEKEGEHQKNEHTRDQKEQQSTSITRVS
jgi:hypothetical protein